MAQSSVTLYGVAGTNIAYTSNNSGKTGTGNLVSLNSGGLSSPRWGIRGSEALSSDLKAIFLLENGFSNDTGALGDSTRLFNRHAYVGLSTSAYGTVIAGRTSSTMYDFILDFAPQAYSTTFEPYNSLASQRVDNAVKYTGDFGPVRVGAYRSFGEQPGGMQANSAWGAAIEASAANLSGTVAFDTLFGAPTAQGYTASKRLGAAVSYEFSKTSIMAGYRWGQDTSATRAVTFRDNLWWFGVRQQVYGPLTLIAAYYYDDVRVQNGTNPPNPWQAAVSAIYSLSKRTDLYGSVAYAKNAGLNFTSVANLDNPNIGQTGVALGIRHKF
ncbi:porin [Ralstonia sp. 21MJYT02-11]|uniref:Porin n=2 Tax=Ralstonia soli TaxID=2953896 RepID=A0ABT1ANC0_9RALS|nr:porin [Ralstonia soli]